MSDNDPISHAREETIRDLQQKLTHARRWVSDLERMLAIASGGEVVAPASYDADRPYARMSIFKATVSYLRVMGTPQTRLDIAKALYAGGLPLPDRDPLSQVKKSITIQAGKGRLVVLEWAREDHEPDDNDIIGLPEWKKD